MLEERRVGGFRRRGIGTWKWRGWVCFSRVMKKQTKPKQNKIKKVFTPLHDFYFKTPRPTKIKTSIDVFIDFIHFVHNFSLGMAFVEAVPPGDIGQSQNRSVGYSLVDDPPNLGPERFVLHHFGNTRESEVARSALNHENFVFRYSNLSNQVLDAILDMPIGFRTRSASNLLSGYPLGLLLYKLKERAYHRFRSVERVDHLVFVGQFIRFKNRLDTGIGVPSIADPDVPYYPKSVSRDVDAFYFVRLPLNRIRFNWPFQSIVDGEITPTTFQGEANISLIDYMRDFTAAPEGSDMTFFVMGNGAYIMKQYHDYGGPDGYSGDFRKSKTKVIRTAGLRQILIRPYQESFHITLSVSNSFERNFAMYIPGGDEGNCFMAALRWGFIQNSIRPLEESCETFMKFWFTILTERSQNQNPRRKKTQKEYLKQYKQSGFPVVELREIARIFFWLTGYKVALWYRKNNGKFGLWTDLLAFDSYVTPRSGPERPYMGIITIFQCVDTGEIRNDSKRAKVGNYSSMEADDFSRNADSGELGRMMHCIAVHPTPFFFISHTKHISSNVSQSLISSGRVSLVKAINERSTNFFDEMNRIRKYWGDINLENLQELVELQKRRYRDGDTRTLIFSTRESKKQKKCATTQDEESTTTTTTTPYWRKRQWEESGGAPEFFVFAYDLETITNTQELHRSPDKVWTPFRDVRFETLPEIQTQMYEPGDNQIPFSAQWIAVNVSDTGIYLDRKQREFGAQPACVNTILDYTPEVEDGEFFLSNAFTEDGEGRLGKCIEDMLVNIAWFTHARGGKKAICYAHNGAHFDAYIVLQYQRFEVSHILKTPRGIMTVSIRVPVMVTYSDSYDYRKDDLEVPKITVILRDTILHVPGSLARLCKGFNVPSQYAKLDFPIQKVNGSNYNHPAISSILRKYGENDVKALGVIIVRINTLIGSSPWQPANIHSLKPPIAQFVTCMGMIRESTRLHFSKVLPKPFHPRAIDIPALRNWLQVATIGGRVNAYAKTYTSRYAGQIFQAALLKNITLLQQLYRDMIHDNQCMQVLDVTSLYPFAMDSCPMPTGSIHSITPEQCLEDINSIGCDECDRLYTLCPVHRCFYQDDLTIQRPFSIVLVKNCGTTMSLASKRNMCPRKSFMKTTGKPTSLVYSLETNDEYFIRTGGKEEIHEVQAFTNIDLYWMRRQGYEFTIIGGFGFGTSMIYNLFIGPAFKNRIQAKKDGNKLLSDFLKLNYNGSFGITTQHDIEETFELARIDDQFKNRDPREPEVRSAIYEASRNKETLSCGIESSEELTGEAVYLQSGQILFQKRKKEHLGEYFNDQSPMQIGAAVLSWSRHIGNLVMFNIGEEDQTYTDTDSFAVGNYVTCPNINPALAARICNRDDAALGTLKNDHAENNGTEPRVFFSMIGAKKVKCHITLNQEGKIRIFNTFKGLNVSTEDEDLQITRHPDYAEYISARTLLHLNMTSSSPPVIVSSWKRDLQMGVNISNHLQTLSPDTYLEDCKGTIVRDKSYGTVEFFIPHGCGIHPDFPVFKNPSTGECTQGQKRQDYLLSQIWKGVESTSLVEAFIEDYYIDCFGEYNPGTEEYQKILDAFRSIEI